MFSDIFSVCLSIEFSFIWQICIVLFCDSHSSSGKGPPFLKITIRCFNLVLYKIRKTFRYAFLGSCCRFLRTLLLLFSGRCYCFPWMQLLFSPDIAVVFLCFCRFCFMFLYKTFRNLYKTEYFLYKKRREFQHAFSDFPVFSYSDPGFFCFFLLTFSEEKSVFFNPTAR